MSGCLRIEYPHPHATYMLEGDIEKGQCLIDALVQEGVLKEWVDNGIRMVAQRQVTCGTEGGQEGTKGTEKVSHVFEFVYGGGGVFVYI